MRREQYPAEQEGRLLEFIKADLAPRYAEFIGNEIQKAYLESYHDFGQNLFDRYVDFADAWIEDIDFKDPDTGQLLNRELLNQELSKIEKPAGIANPKDFRNEVVKFTLRARAGHGGKNPSWTSYEKIREVIERRMFSQVEDLLPVISFGSKKDGDSREEARGVRVAHGRARLHRAASPPPGRVVHARQASGLRRAANEHY
jgi:serine protein kinase